MSWLCKQCETVNSDNALECEVCDAVSPYLSRFDYDEIDPSRPTTLRWQAEGCNTIILSYHGREMDVTHLHAARIIANKDTKVTFRLYGDVADREFTYAVRENKPPLTRNRYLKEGDLDFFKELCSDEEFNRYFTLGRFGDNAESFFYDTIEHYKIGKSLPYVIETEDSLPIGMITCQIELEEEKTIGIISYAVLAEYRNYGIATDALMHMRSETKKVGVDILKLFISSANASSKRVAEKCGFKCLAKADGQSEEKGGPVLLTWNYIFSEHISKREVLIKKALDTFKNDECDKAIHLIENALKFKCPRMSKYNDALAYYYLGEIYAYQRKFGKAYDCYVKSKSLGYEANKIDKQINWIKANMFSLKSL
jgi:RimJ/RimL family protein N-acetyltransferase